MTEKAKECYKIVAQNRKARHNFFLTDEYEAGLVLLGSEIKSLRNGKCNIQDAYVEYDKNGELYLVNSSIPPYKMSTFFNHEATRKRKLLLKKKEIKRIIGKLKVKGFTMIPIVLYINHKNIAKIKIALAEGKKLYDKRQTIKDRDIQRNKQLSLKYSNY